MSSPSKMVGLVPRVAAVGFILAYMYKNKEAIAESPYGYAAGLIIACFLVVSTFAGLVMTVLASRYSSLVKNNGFDVDKYVLDPTPSIASRAKCVLLHRLNVGSHKASSKPITLGEVESPYVPGLRVTCASGTRSGDEPYSAPKSGAIVVGTIRMGFGHHRIAYAATSWAQGEGCTTYFHDLLNIDSPEATLIKDKDALYSKGSRLATEMGGAVEKLWGSFTKSGDENGLRLTYQMAEHLKPLLAGLPLDTPIIASHCLVGMVAVAIGFKHVINLVIDNHAQWFITVPGAINLVQGFSNYHNLLRMGVPAKDLVLAGAWIPKQLVEGIPADCAARIARAKARKPRRLLIPVGGAGAQKTFVSNFVKALGSQLEAGKVQLMLNAADHPHMKSAFIESLDAIGYAYDEISTIEGVHAFCDKLRAGGEASPVTLFAFEGADAYFPAVATTDIVSRVADVLCCKPSELAFYPVPKLMLRRVGDHEAYSALRASELGDGTLELREVSDAMAYVELMDQGPELLTNMNECIVRNAEIGAYNGCKVAAEMAAGFAKA